MLIVAKLIYPYGHDLPSTQIGDLGDIMMLVT